MESLQEQLLKAGLVDKSRANKAKKEQQQQSKRARHSGAKTASKENTAGQQERAMRAERDRELNAQKQQQVEQKATQAQIKQLVELNKIDKGAGEIAYSFVYKSKVRKIYVTAEIKQQLAEGRLAIVRLLLKSERRFEIVPAAVAAKIAQRDENTIVQFNEKTDGDKSDDDPYAEYQIPDDLTW